MRQTNFKKQFTGLILLTAILSGNFSAFAQPKRAAVAASKTQTASNQKNGKTCNSGYSGSVTYTKTLTESYTDPKTGSSGSRNKVFTVNIPIRDDGRQTGRVTTSPYDGRVNGTFNFKARATATLSDVESSISKSAGDEVCSFSIGGIKKKPISCQSTSNWQGQATGEGEVTVFLGLDYDKLHISSDIPRITGQMNRTFDSSCAGGCGTKKPTSNSETIAVNEKYQSFYTDHGAATFNPQSFDRLNGSFTRARGAIRSKSSPGICRAALPRSESKTSRSRITKFPTRPRGAALTRKKERLTATWCACAPKSITAAAMRLTRTSNFRKRPRALNCPTQPFRR